MGGKAVFGGWEILYALNFCSHANVNCSWGLSNRNLRCLAPVFPELKLNLCRFSKSTVERSFPVGWSGGWEFVA